MDNVERHAFGLPADPQDSRWVGPASWRTWWWPKRPLEIRLGTVPLAVLMRTPGHDAELIKGFFITEGIVVGEHEIADVRAVEGDPEKNRWEVILADGVHVDPSRFPAQRLHQLVVWRLR